MGVGWDKELGNGCEHAHLGELYVETSHVLSEPTHCLWSGETGEGAPLVLCRSPGDFSRQWYLPTFPGKLRNYTFVISRFIRISLAMGAAWLEDWLRVEKVT